MLTRSLNRMNAGCSSAHHDLFSVNTNLAAKGKIKRYFGSAGRAYAVTLMTHILKNHVVAPLATNAREGLCLVAVTRTVSTPIYILNRDYNPRGQTEGKMTTSLITPLTTGYRMLGAFLFLVCSISYPGTL